MRHLGANTGAVRVSRRMQLSLIVLAVLYWFISALLPLLAELRYSSVYGNNYVWLLMFAQFALPLLFWAIALIYATQHYVGRLHQMFIGVLLAVFGVLIYQIAQLLLHMYQYAVVGPRDYMETPSFWQQVGPEASVMVVSLIVFTALVWHHDRRLQRL